jgi:hypothetical protein
VKKEIMNVVQGWPETAQFNTEDCREESQDSQKGIFILAPLAPFGGYSSRPVWLSRGQTVINLVNTSQTGATSLIPMKICASILS